MTFRVDWQASDSTLWCRMGVRQQFNLHCKGRNISTDLGVRCALPWTSHCAMRNGESMQCTHFQAFWIVKWARCFIRIKSECPVSARLFPWSFFCAPCLHLLHITFDEIPSCSICLELFCVISLSPLVFGIWEFLIPKAICLSGFPENLYGVWQKRFFLDIT